MGQRLPKVPFIYSDGYNVRFLGLEKLHPFDSCKYEKIAKFLRAHIPLQASQFYEPAQAATREELLDVHTPQYLDSLHSSAAVARICELPPLAILPNCLIQRHVIQPNLLAVKGTMMAAQLALQFGFAINLGGGMHHASSEQGGGWCIFSDIFLAYRAVKKERPDLKMMIVDLDVHQGNGHERDKLKFRDDDVFIVDAYNPSIYPGDEEAKQAINAHIFIRRGMIDEKYLTEVERVLEESIAAFRPGLIAYNAGTDILAGDPLNGGVGITADGIARRDELVFRKALEHRVPVMMVLSGGYARENAAVVGSSILNLVRKFDLVGRALAVLGTPAAEQADAK